MWNYIVDPTLYHDVKPWQRAFSSSTVFTERFYWVSFRLINFLVNLIIFGLTLHENWKIRKRFFWYFSHWSLIFNIVYLFLALLVTIQATSPSVAGKVKLSKLAVATTIVQSIAYPFTIIASVWYWVFILTEVQNHDKWFDDISVHGGSMACMALDAFFNHQSYRPAHMVFPYIVGLIWFGLAHLVSFVTPVQEYFGRDYIYYTTDYLHKPELSYFCLFIAMNVAGPLCGFLVYLFFCYKFLFFRTIYVVHQDPPTNIYIQKRNNQNENIGNIQNQKYDESASETSEGTSISDSYTPINSIDYQSYHTIICKKNTKYDV